MVWPFSSKKRGVFDDDPDYQQLPVEQQSQLARDYAKEVIQSDPDYIALPKDLQTELLRDYFSENLPKPKESAPAPFGSALEAYPELLKTPLATGFQNVPAEAVTEMVKAEREKSLPEQLGGLAEWSLIGGPKALLGPKPVPLPSRIPAINLLKPKITGIKGKAPRGVPIPRFFPPEPEILTTKELAMRKVPIPGLTAKEKTAIIGQAEREGGGYIVGKKPRLGSETVKTTLFPGMEKKVKLTPADVPKTPLMPQRVGPSISAGGSLRPDIGKSQFEIIQEEMAQAKGKPQYAGPREEFISTPEGTIIPPEGVAPLKLGDPNLSAFEQAKKQLGTVTGEPPIPPKGKQPKPKKTIPPVSLGETSQLPPVPKFAKKAPDRAPEWVYEQKEPIVYQYEGYDPNVKLHAYTAQIQGGEALSHNNSSVFITKNRLKSGMVKPEDKIIGGPFATETKATLPTKSPAATDEYADVLEEFKEKPSKPPKTELKRVFPGELEIDFMYAPGTQLISQIRKVTEAIKADPGIKKIVFLPTGKAENIVRKLGDIVKTHPDRPEQMFISRKDWLAKSGKITVEPPLPKEVIKPMKGTPPTPEMLNKIDNYIKESPGLPEQDKLSFSYRQHFRIKGHQPSQELSAYFTQYGKRRFTLGTTTYDVPNTQEHLTAFKELISKGSRRYGLPLKDLQGIARIGTLVGAGAGVMGLAVLPKILTPTLPHTETEERLKKLAPAMQIPEYKAPYKQILPPITLKGLRAKPGEPTIAEVYPEVLKNKLVGKLFTGEEPISVLPPSMIPKPEGLYKTPGTKEYLAQLGELAGSTLIAPGRVVVGKGQGVLRKKLAEVIARAKKEPINIEGYEVDELLGIPEKIAAGSKATKLRKQVTDRFAGLELWERQIRNIKDWAKVPAGKSPYKLGRLYAGRWGLVVDINKKLTNILYPLKKEKKDFERLWLARRAEERLAREIPTGNMTPEKVSADITRLTQKYGRETIEQWDNNIEAIVYTMDESILQPMRDTGLLSEQAYQAIITKNKKWAPFDVLSHLSEDPDRVFIGAEVFSVASQDIVKAMKGLPASRQITSLYDALARRIPVAISTIERNKVARAFLALVDDTPELKGVVVPKGQGAAPRGYGTITAYIGGKPQSYWVPSFMEDAMKHLRPQEVSLIGKIFAKSGHFFRAGVTTYNPVFIISNPVRDYRMAKLAAENGINLKEWIGGFKEALKYEFGFESKFYAEILANKGGFASWTQSLQKASTGAKQLFESPLTKRIKIFSNPIAWIGRTSQAFELATRIAASKRTFKATGSMLDAAWDARNATIDFAKAGDLMKWANLYVPFLNARIQGIANIARVAKTKPAHTAWVAATWGLAPALATWLYNQKYYAEEDKDIPQWLKDDYDYIIVGKEYDDRLERDVPKIAAFPKGDVGKIFGNPIIHALEYIKTREPEKIASFAAEWFSDISPIDIAGKEGKPSLLKAASSIVPPIAKGPLEVATNLDWYRQTPLIPRRLEGISPAEQYTERTPELFKKAGKITSRIGISPIELQHLARSTGGEIIGQGISPIKTGEAIKRRFFRPAGGEREEKVWDILQGGKSSYKTARKKIQEAYHNYDRAEVNRLKRLANSQARESRQKLRDMDVYDLQNFGYKTAIQFEKAISFSEEDLKRAKQDALRKK